MQLDRAELRAAVQPTEAAAEDTGGAVVTEKFMDLLSVLNGMDGISKNTAMNIPAVAGGVEFITAQAAAVPFRLYRRTAKGLEEVKKDSRAGVLNYDTGDLLSNTEMLQSLYRDYLLDGNGYLYINRRGNHLKSLHYVDCSKVAVTVDPDPIFKTGHVYVCGAAYRPWEFIRLCRHSVDGLSGKGILKENSKMLALAWATLVLQNSIMKGGGNARGFLTSDRNLTDPQMTALKKGFAELYRADGNGIVILNKGMDFKQASNTAVEMQLQEIVQQNRQEIMLMLGVPYEVITGKGTEDQFNAAIQRAVVPVITAMETALNRDLLLEREKGTLVWRADTTELTKGAIKQRYEAYKVATEGGWIGKNEIRQREGLPVVDGLDIIGMNLADVLFDMKTGQFYTPNTGSVMGGKEPAPGEASPAPADPPPGNEPLPDGGGDGILEARSRDYKRDDKGRFAYSGGRAKRGAKKAVRLKKAEYAKVTHEISTNYHAKYAGKRTGFLLLATDAGYFKYDFTIHGYDDYTITRRRRI